MARPKRRYGGRHSTSRLWSSSTARLAKSTQSPTVADTPPPADCCRHLAPRCAQLTPCRFGRDGPCVRISAMPDTRPRRIVFAAAVKNGAAKSASGGNGGQSTCSCGELEAMRLPCRGDRRSDDPRLSRHRFRPDDRGDPWILRISEECRLYGAQQMRRRLQAPRCATARRLTHHEPKRGRVPDHTRRGPLLAAPTSPEVDCSVGWPTGCRNGSNAKGGDRFR